MTAMFPGSGVPASDARNSIPDPLINPATCDPLWYSTSRCQPRFDPAAANAQLAELIHLINKGEVAYDCTYLDQVQLAVRYLIQRGMPHGGLTAAGPSAYTMALDPPATRYNDYMTLTVVPNTSNIGAVNLSLNGLTYAPVLRNDGQQLQTGDWRANRPTVISFYQGNFFHVGLVASQVPIFLSNDLTLWVRPDGNDATGDGSANSPDKAFRTIQHAADVSGSRFALSQYTVNIRLGIPGAYEGAMLTSAISRMGLIGDPANYGAYRISAKSWGSSAASIGVSNQSLYMTGVTCLMDYAAQGGPGLTVMSGGMVQMSNVKFEVGVVNPGAGFIGISDGSSIYTTGTLEFQGNGHSFSSAIGLIKSSSMWRSDPTFPVTALFKNCVFTGQAFVVADVSSLDWDATTLINTACTGPKHLVTSNSVLRMNGQAEPGDVAGSVSTGGQFIP
jgi:hypothetical protein